MRSGLIKHLCRLSSNISVSKNMHKSGLKSSNAAAKKPLAANGENTLPVKFQVLPSPAKSFSDKKTYKVIQLENGLTACLISDMFGPRIEDDDSDSESDLSSESEATDTSSLGSSESESSSEDESSSKSISGDDDDKRPLNTGPEVKLAAVALCIGVGSFSDPKEVQGLAHFLEHMVFMGSEKYPKENEFDSFIKKHGGSDNATTDYELTTFYFDCFEKSLLRSMDRFAQFFISPLMNKDSMTRERQAVDSEFNMALHSDEHRHEQLLVGTARKDSPVNTFSWGNTKSLTENISDDKLYEYLHEFRKRHYSAHRMTLAIQARLPIETLESYVISCFSNIPNNSLPSPKFSDRFNQEVFDTPEFNRLYYVKPVSDTNELELTWMLPPLQRMYKSKPHEYLLWLVGHEGRGSLLSYLKDQLWALAITGEGDEISSSIYTQFSITITLTQEGVENVKAVIGAVFSYLQMLKNEGPDERIFKEMQLIEEIAFRFEEEESAAERVEDLAENMQMYPPEDYLTGPEMFFEYNPELITSTLNYLIPSKLNITLLSSTKPDSLKYEKVEPWFETEYTDTDISSEWLDEWSKCEALPQFHLPAPNRFITEDFTLLPAEENVPAYPEKILESSLIELWYRKDQKFGLPLAHYIYHFASPCSQESAMSACMMDIYVSLLYVHLAEEGYSAGIAELLYEVLSNEKGIAIKISGYNQKLPVLIDMIARHMKKVGPDLKENLFEAVKREVMQSLHNRLLKPGRLCREVRLSILQNKYVTLLEKYKVISTISHRAMVDFCNKFLQHFYVHALIQGNVSKTDALNATHNLLNVLSFSALEPGTYPKITVNEIPNGEHCLRIMSLNKDNVNSVITNYYQHGMLTIKDSVIIDLILYLTEEPLFDMLRTKEQLGYNVSQSLRDTSGVLGYSFTVHARSNKHSVQHVDSRIEAFIKRSYKTLKKMHEKKFKQAKQALVQLKRCADVDLEDEVSRNWSEIFHQDYMFNRVETEIKTIEELKLDEVKKWWLEHNVFNDNGTFKKITFQVVGYNKSKEEGVDEEKETQSIQKLGRKTASVTIDTSDLILKPLEDSNEKKPESYFIKDIDAFRKSLLAYTKS